ncbi:MAG: 50S ribosomal protein L19 [Parachlamydiales bacterium]|jgi:large subunit ribosomal protein L19
MSKLALIKQVEESQLKKDIPDFKVGDTLKIYIRIIEGDKERIQQFTGTVVARKGSGLSETISLYRVAFGGSVKRVFLLHNPRIAKIERLTEGHVRRAKLNYLVGTSGKKSRVRQKMGGAKSRAAVVAPQESDVQSTPESNS